MQKRSFILPVLHDATVQRSAKNVFDRDPLLIPQLFEDGPPPWYAVGKNGLFGPHSAIEQKRKLPKPSGVRSSTAASAMTARLRTWISRSTR